MCCSCRSYIPSCFRDRQVCIGKSRAQSVQRLRDHGLLPACDPEAHGKGNMLIAQATHCNGWLRLRQDKIDLLERLENLLRCFFPGKILLGQLDNDAGAPFAVERVVDNNAAKDKRIRYRYLFPAHQAQLRSAHLHILYSPGAADQIADGDLVSDVKGALHQNVEPRHQVFQDVLNRKGNCHRHYTDGGYRDGYGYVPDRQYPENDKSQYDDVENTPD